MKHNYRDKNGRFTAKPIESEKTSGNNHLKCISGDDCPICNMGKLAELSYPLPKPKPAILVNGFDYSEDPMPILEYDGDTKFMRLEQDEEHRIRIINGPIRFKQYFNHMGTDKVFEKYMMGVRDINDNNNYKVLVCGKQLISEIGRVLFEQKQVPQKTWTKIKVEKIINFISKRILRRKDKPEPVKELDFTIEKSLISEKPYKYNYRVREIGK